MPDDDGRPRAGAAPLLSLRHGAHRRADRLAADRRGDDLERGGPCNIALMRQAQAAKKGVAAAGGTPREFTTITVTDRLARLSASRRGADD